MHAFSLIKALEMKSVCCVTYNIWHHLQCSGLDKKEFLEHINKKTLKWVCEKCSVYNCDECIKVMGKNKSVYFVILVTNGSTDRKCSLLGKKDFDKIGNSEEPWFCLSYKKDNLPFQTLSPMQIRKLCVIPRKHQNQNDEKIFRCKIFNKKIITLKMVWLVVIANTLPIKNVQYKKLATNLLVMNVCLTCFLLQIFKIMIYWT